MNYIPQSLSRLGHRQLLKIDKNRPTIMVVAGVVGLGVTAVMAARATRKLDPILDSHAKQRVEIPTTTVTQQQEKREIVRLYYHTGYQLGRLYGPTILVGTLSATSVLSGHRILKGRHVATMMAYTGLLDQYQAYRARVSETFGEELEKDIHAGAVGKWEEDPDHPGEAKLKAQFKPEDQKGSYLRPLFDESNDNWVRDPMSNYLFLKAVQNHMNNLLKFRGHVFLSEVYDALGIPRTQETIVTGWVQNGNGDNFVDLGFMTERTPEATMFRNGAENSVWLNFNIDGVIWDLI